MTSLPERGRLDEHPLPRLLLDLYRASFSGTLGLSRERVKKSIQFHGGVPTFAESNLASESLGTQLIDQGALAREDYSRVVDYMARKPCKEERALLDLHLLDPKQLFGALREQVRRRVVECFGWPNGEFELGPDGTTPSDAQALGSDPIALLQSGLEAHWTPERFLEALADRLGCYPRPSSRFERVRARLDADAAVSRLLDGLDGSRTFGELIATAKSPRALAAAWILDATGALDYADAPAGTAQEAAEDQSPDGPEIEVVVRSREARDDAAAGFAARPRPSAKGRKASDAEAAPLRRAILETHGRLGDLDHYALLDVDRDANPATIKRTYFSLAKRYHPDALSAVGLESVRRQASEIFAQLSKAYEVLSDLTRRREYDRNLGRGDDEDEAVRVANAEIMYRKAEILLRQGNFRGALEYLKPAVELWPSDVEYQSALGWALYKQPASDAKGARTHLEKAIEIDPKNATALFRLSVVLRASGDAKTAAKLMAGAKAIDPQIDRRS